MARVNGIDGYVLTAKEKAEVLAAVEAGLFASERSALKRGMERWVDELKALRALRSGIDQGFDELDSGKGIPYAKARKQLDKAKRRMHNTGRGTR